MVASLSFFDGTNAGIVDQVSNVIFDSINHATEGLNAFTNKVDNFIKDINSTGLNDINSLRQKFESLIGDTTNQINELRGESLSRLQAAVNKLHDVGIWNLSGVFDFGKSVGSIAQEFASNYNEALQNALNTFIHLRDGVLSGNNHY